MSTLEILILSAGILIGFLLEMIYSNWEYNREEKRESEIPFELKVVEKEEEDWSSFLESSFCTSCGTLIENLARINNWESTSKKTG